MARFCSECGAALEEGAGFCAGCGAAVTPSVQPSVQPQPVDMQPRPAYPQPQSVYPQPQQQAPFLQPYPEQTAQPFAAQPAQPMPQRTYQPISPSAPERRYATPINARGPQPYVTPEAPGQTGTKSHLALGIIVVSAIVLLIAAAIIVFVVIKPFGGSSDTKAELQSLLDKENAYFYNTDEPDVEAVERLHYNYQFLLTPSEQEYYCENAASYHTEMRKYYKETYGDDVVVKSELKEFTTLSGGELDDAKWDYSPASADEADPISEIVRAHVVFSLSGSKKSESTDYYVIFIKRDGKWYIGGWNEYTGDSDDDDDYDDCVSTLDEF